MKVDLPWQMFLESVISAGLTPKNRRYWTQKKTIVARQSSKYELQTDVSEECGQAYDRSSI
jgi:hypothetical protein